MGSLVLALTAQLSLATDAPLEAPLEAGTGRVVIGQSTWRFSFDEGPGARCGGSLGNRRGIVALGYEVDSSGTRPARGATLELEIYPEDWTPRGKQANRIAVRGSDGVSWTTASVSVIEANAGVPTLAEARVSDWTLADGETRGTVTLYRKDSLLAAQSGGDLVLDEGTFEVVCPP